MIIYFRVSGRPSLEEVSIVQQLPETVRSPDGDVPYAVGREVLRKGDAVESASSEAEESLSDLARFPPKVGLRPLHSVAFEVVEGGPSVDAVGVPTVEAANVLWVFCERGLLPRNEPRIPISVFDFV